MFTVYYRVLMKAAFNTSLAYGATHKVTNSPSLYIGYFVRRTASPRKYVRCFTLMRHCLLTDEGVFSFDLKLSITLQTEKMSENFLSESVSDGAHHGGFEHFATKTPTQRSPLSVVRELHGNA